MDTVLNILFPMDEMYLRRHLLKYGDKLWIQFFFPTGELYPRSHLLKYVHKPFSFAQSTSLLSII